MSTLIEKIAEALTAHSYWHRKQYAPACKCGTLLGEGTHTDDALRDHQAEVIVAVVAEWLASREALLIVSTEIMGRTATAGAARALSALADEAEMGAGQ